MCDVHVAHGTAWLVGAQPAAGVRQYVEPAVLVHFKLQQKLNRRLACSEQQARISHTLHSRTQSEHFKFTAHAKTTKSASTLSGSSPFDSEIDQNRLYRLVCSSSSA